MFDVVDEGDRFAENGFQVIGQVLLGIAEQSGLQAHHQRFGGTEPTALVSMRFNAQYARTGEYRLLLGKGFFSLYTKEIRGNGYKAGYGHGATGQAGDKLFLHKAGSDFWIRQRLKA